ncbi:MAG TPA: GNAT family protein [Candidatus Paceibacterota bacterium]|nr:GNAT family protein [Candidatus Paceibacterota bacterium]
MIWWPTEIPTLPYGLITLRPTQEKDIVSIYEACQDPVIPRFTTVPSPYTMTHATSFIREQAPTHFLQKKELLFAITQGLAEDEQFCGVISFHTISLQNHTAELGYWIAAPSRGQGIGTTAAKLISEYGFSTIGFRRIEALVNTDNIGSQALLISAGYKREGVMRKKVTREDGTQIDMALFSRITP